MTLEEVIKKAFKEYYEIPTAGTPQKFLAQAIRNHYKSLVPEEKEYICDIKGQHDSHCLNTGFNQCRELMLKRISTT